MDSLNHVPIELVFPDNIFHGWAGKLTNFSDNNDGKLLENMSAHYRGMEFVFNIRTVKVNNSGDQKSDLIITLDDITDQTETGQRLFDLQTFAEKGQMASSIAHELNNHLGLILGGVEMTQLALQKGNQEKAENTINKLIDAIGHMTRFTKGLMDYTELETKKEPENLNEIIVDVLSFVSVQKKFRTIHINTELDPNCPTIKLDRDQMAQLLLNFLNNSIDAIAEAKNKKGQINILTHLTNDGPELIISDNGIGLDPKIKDQLFKSRITNKKGGHGYGLMTCSKILRNHNAKITVGSEKGQGAKFIFTFPIENNFGPLD